jgi:hypothetical protein
MTNLTLDDGHISQTCSDTKKNKKEIIYRCVVHNTVESMAFAN